MPNSVLLRAVSSRLSAIKTVASLMRACGTVLLLADGTACPDRPAPRAPAGPGRQPSLVIAVFGEFRHGKTTFLAAPGAANGECGPPQPGKAAARAARRLAAASAERRGFTGSADAGDRGAGSRGTPPRSARVPAPFKHVSGCLPRTRAPGARSSPGATITSPPQRPLPRRQPGPRGRSCSQPGPAAARGRPATGISWGTTFLRPARCRPVAKITENQPSRLRPLNRTRASRFPGDTASARAERPGEVPHRKGL
jgi:hypothetical protein